MTRTGDIAPPTVTAHPLPPGSPIAGWRYRPLIALERLDQPAYAWDDADPDVTWDDTTPTRTWDAAFIAGGYTDAVCDFHTLDIDPGQADELYLFPPVTATLTLDNRDGAWSTWAADGRLVYWAPGRRLHVLAVADQGTGEKLWLFSGRVASWTMNADDTVTIVAYDGLSWLAQQLGGNWTFGAAGDTVTQRFTAVLSAAGYPDRVDVEAGTVTLATVTDDHAPLEHLQRVALSDGGLFYGDADGSLDYRGRLWRAGRSDQASPPWLVSDNHCTVPVVVWNPEMAADDDRLATDVRLTNLTPLTATATLTGSLWSGDAKYRLSHPDPDLWQTQAQGDALAAYLLAQQSTPSLAMSGFELYALDPHQPAAGDMAARVRRGDRVEVLHDYPAPTGTETLDVFGIVLGVGHNISPESWVSSLALSRTVDWHQVEEWDRTAYPWDSTAPANVWRY